MLRFHGVMVRPRFGVYDEEGELVDEAIGAEVPVFTAEQFAKFVQAAQDEAEWRNVADLAADPS